MFLIWAVVILGPPTPNIGIGRIGLLSIAKVGSQITSVIILCKIGGLLWSCCIQPSEMGSKGGKDSQWGWWGWLSGWKWVRVATLCGTTAETKSGEASTELSDPIVIYIQTSWQIQTVCTNCLLFFFLLPIPFMSDGAMPHVLLMVVNYSSRCLKNKSQITCVCKMVINNASVPRNHRWILTYHLRQFPENVALLLPMVSRSVQVFYNFCQKKITRVCQCPESEGSRLRDSKW